MSAVNDDESLVICKYSDNIQIQVPKWILLRFTLFRNVNEDCSSEDNSFYANIPIINDGIGNPIQFNENELSLFFKIAAIENITNEDFNESNITSDLLKRFLILANFLDYDYYLNSLCKYAAYLIIVNKMTLP